MFEQILCGPFTRTHYILSNICTIGIVGLASAFLIVLVGSPIFAGSVQLQPLTVPLIVFAAVVGSVLFGSIASIISTRLRSSEGFNVIINTVFLFFAFVSTAFYPAQGAPEPLATAFYLNPLTYLVDVIRAGLFGAVDMLAIYEMLALLAMASGLFALATKLITRLDL